MNTTITKVDPSDDNAIEKLHQDLRSENNEVKSAFAAANNVIELAKLLIANGYQVKNSDTSQDFRYSLYAPKGWTEILDWSAYLDWEAGIPKPNGGYLGDFVGTAQGIEWVLVDPVDSPPKIFPNPAHCEALQHLATILKTDVRELFYES